MLLPSQQTATVSTVASLLQFAAAPQAQLATRDCVTGAGSLAANVIHAVARGGSTATTVHPSEVVDLTRMGMRLTAMSSYALVSSLLLGSGLYLFAITPLKTETTEEIKNVTKTQIIDRRVTNVFAIVIAVCIATSLHTSLSFNAMSLYANSALGQGLDSAFVTFWNAGKIQNLRQSAFLSFCVAIESFKLSFVLSIFLKTNKRHRWVATGLTSILMVASSFQFWQMLGVASKLIFHRG